MADRPILTPLDRMAHYLLTRADADAINRRIDALLTKGSRASEGDVLPMLITSVTWPEDPEAKAPRVNGQVLTDGNDVLWVVNIVAGQKPGTYQPVF